METPENSDDIARIIVRPQALQEQVGGIYNEIADAIAHLAKVEQALAKRKAVHPKPKDELLRKIMEGPGQMGWDPAEYYQDDSAQPSENGKPKQDY